MQQYADIYLLQSHSTCFGCAQTSPDQASIMTCTGGCGYSF